MKLFQVFLSLALTGVIAAAIAAFWVMSQFGAAGPLETDKLVLIEKGSSLRGIARKLEDEGVIDNRMVFMLGTRAKGAQAQLRAGEYQFKAGMSPLAAMKLLQSGESYYHQITFAEGLTAAEIVALLNGNEVLTGEIETLPREGSLLPDTYNFHRGDTRADIIRRMQNASKSALEELWENRAENLPFDTPEEAMTLASIVEKETGVPEERARVAGVFVNRLRIGMPLQSDPTVIYALTGGREKLDRPLYRTDWKFESPYNTYLHPGLPPHPIANPGRDSIQATLNPESHDYLFFVADGTGGHAFASSLAEHNRNVAKWRKIRDGK